MNNQKTLVIGCVNTYDYSKIEQWLTSLNKSGFDGIKALIAYNMDKNTVNKLTDMGVHIFAFEKDAEDNLIYPDDIKNSLMVNRFGHIYSFLRNIDLDFSHVITTDVRDVIFQNDPNIIIKKYPNKIIVGSENLLYKNEPWGRNNLLHAFPKNVFGELENKQIVCAGVIMGPKELFLSLVQNIYLMCFRNPHTLPGGGGPDQAALNVILNFEPYKQHTQILNDHSIIHMGTSMEAIASGSGGIGQEFARKIKDDMHNFLPQDDINKIVLEYKSRFIENKTLTFDAGKVYCNSNECIILHQYDRVKYWNNEFINMYRSD